MKRYLGAVLSGAAVMVAVPSLASGASVVKCQTRVYPGANTPVFVTSARGLTCKAAAREQRRYQWTGENRLATPGGYGCVPSGRGTIGDQLRRVKGSRAYRIEFED
jgi:hypothetical protein